MFKRFCVLLVAVALLHSTLVVESCAADMQLSAHSAVVMIAATGEVVFEKDAHTRRGMASTTKIMTSIVALENVTLKDCVTVKAEHVAVEGTSMGLKAGDKVTVDDLLKGMLLASGNDAANVTATFVSGSIESFSLLMNSKAKELGMNNTSFRNPSGLTEDGHYSTAYDMALLGSYAIKNKVFREMCSTLKTTVSIGEPIRETTLYNHNKLLSKYDGAIGIKTGFTKAAGRCLVTAVERDGVVLVAVTLNAYDDWNDHIKLYDYAFSKVQTVTEEISLTDIRVPVCNSSEGVVRVSSLRPVIVPYVNKKPQYTVKIFVPHFVYAPVRKGDLLGWVEIYAQNGSFISKEYIVSAEKINPLQVSGCG